MRKPLLYSAGLGLLLGAAAGSFMMYAAWQHNPQGRFHDESGIHWLQWADVGLSWLLVVGLPGAAGLAAVSCGSVALWRLFRRA